MKRGCLIAPTTADIRDVMIEGPSGLLAVAPPWCQPRFEIVQAPRRLAQRGGRGRLSGEEPDRARGFTSQKRQERARTSKKQTTKD